MSHEGPVPQSDGLTRLSIDATSDAVRTALAEACGIWASQAADPDLCAAAEQVLAEVLNNVVEHAQAGKSDGTVLLDTAVRGGKVHCAVLDDGVELPDLQLPPGHRAVIGDDLHSLPEGGFGWFMIRAMTHSLSYDRANGWNHLEFSIIHNKSA